MKFVFHLSKSEHYFYDAEAIAEPAKTWGERDRTNGKYHSEGFAGIGPPHKGLKGKPWTMPDRSGGKSVTEGNDRHAATNLHRSLLKQDQMGPTAVGFNERYASSEPPTTRNKRDVWTIASEPFEGAHFAVMPTELARVCILAGCPVGGTVLDPFVGAGTVPLVAQRTGRHAIGIDLNRGYLTMAAERVQKDAPLLSDVQVIENTEERRHHVAENSVITMD